MKSLFTKAAAQPVPKNRQEAINQGYTILKPTDWLFIRDVDGPGDGKDDHYASHGIGRQEFSENFIHFAERVRDEALGPQELMTADKAVRKQGTSEFIGGIQFERSPRVNTVAGTSRSYTCGVSYQIPKSMEAPCAGSQLNGDPLDEHLVLRSNLTRVGTEAAATLMATLPQEDQYLLKSHAELMNVARVGSDTNFCFPTVQFNVASPSANANAGSIDPGSKTKAENSQECHSNTGALFHEAQGQFSDLHCDVADTPVTNTVLFNISKPHPDIDPQDDLFYLPEFGVAWEMAEFTAISFSGLFWHSGRLPGYCSPRTSDEVFYRLALVMYPKEALLCGTSSVAFAALPGYKSKDIPEMRKGQDQHRDQQPLIRIPFELRDPRNWGLPTREACNQATYIADGLAIMPPMSYLNMISRCFALLIASIISQSPPDRLLRFNRQQFLSSFSMNIDGERIQAEDHELAPGWNDEDTAPGSIYTDIPTDLKQLESSWNADKPTSPPFVNKAAVDLQEKFDALRVKRASFIPLCVMASALAGNEVGGTPAIRRAIVRKVKNDPSDSVGTKHHRPGKGYPEVPEVPTKRFCKGKGKPMGQDSTRV
ncbi:hypothetical protein HGRIS_001219 [Hohenbuehelia grisea]|uniref:Uncharacterized protein n=1 Tax=Hohenbuehelia grisea TaxID=104357 RepID=A0ABR3JPN7_9AGAR